MIEHDRISSRRTVPRQKVASVASPERVGTSSLRAALRQPTQAETLLRPDALKIARQGFAFVRCANLPREGSHSSGGSGGGSANTTKHERRRGNRKKKKRSLRSQQRYTQAGEQARAPIELRHIRQRPRYTLIGSDGNGCEKRAADPSSSPLPFPLAKTENSYKSCRPTRATTSTNSRSSIKRNTQKNPDD